MKVMPSLMEMKKKPKPKLLIATSSDDVEVYWRTEEIDSRSFRYDNTCGRDQECIFHDIPFLVFPVAVVCIFCFSCFSFVPFCLFISTLSSFFNLFTPLIPTSCMSMCIHSIHLLFSTGVSSDF